MLSVHNAASGEFVAHLDGDDVMLPGKLQVQVDFLRAHARHVIVAHDMEIIDENSAPVGPNFGIGREPPSADLSELVTRGCYFAHSSKMYRRNAASIRERDRETVDFLFHIDQARHGLVGYLNQPLGRYRRTQSGLSSINSRFKQSVLQGHLDAYDFALARGVPEAVVYPAKLNFRYVNGQTGLTCSGSFVSPTGRSVVGRPGGRGLSWGCRLDLRWWWHGCSIAGADVGSGISE